MTQVIIYPQISNSIATVFPAPGLSVVEVAKKDVPQGFPYRIINESDLPSDDVFFDAWEADFSNPDGYGMGAEAYYATTQTQELNAEEVAE